MVKKDRENQRITFKKPKGLQHCRNNSRRLNCSLTISTFILTKVTEEN